MSQLRPITDRDLIAEADRNYNLGRRHRKDELNAPEGDVQRLAAKVLLYLGDSPEHAATTFAEDRGTFDELIWLAESVRKDRTPATTKENQ